MRCRLRTGSTRNPRYIWESIANCQCRKCSQSQYKQVAICRTTSQIWKRFQEIYDQSAESKASELLLQFIHIHKKSTQTMKNYLDTLTEPYNINMGELALCVKALDGLPESYKHIKAAETSSQINKIPRLTNLLLSK